MRNRLKVIGLIMFTVACNGDELERAIAQSFVVGTVTSTAGQPIAGATIEVWAVLDQVGQGRVGDCVGSAIPEVFTGVTSSNGRFRVRVASGLTFSSNGCLHLEATSPNPAYRTAVKSGIPIVFGATPDSVIADIALPSAP